LAGYQNFDRPRMRMQRTVAHILMRCRDIRRRELSGIGRLDLGAILNEYKLAKSDTIYGTDADPWAI
jgi:hypothetical protein